MNSPRIWKCLLFSCSTLVLGGCGSSGPGKPVETAAGFTIGEKNGVATIQLGKCSSSLRASPAVACP